MNTSDYTLPSKAAVKSVGIWGNVLALLSIFVTLATLYTENGTIPPEALLSAFSVASPIFVGLYGRVTATRPIGGLFKVR